MVNNTKQRLGGMLLAVSLGLATVSSAQAQQGQTSGAGFIFGEVDKCVNGNETPVAGVYVGIAGGESTLARTDQMGDFVLALSPGQYTVTATADDGTTANRPYVPVEADTQLDIGVLELAGGCAGNGIGALPPAAPAPAQPTAAPTAPPPTATPVPPSPTPRADSGRANRDARARDGPTPVRPVGSGPVRAGGGRLARHVLGRGLALRRASENLERSGSARARGRRRWPHRSADRRPRRRAHRSRRSGVCQGF